MKKPNIPIVPIVTLGTGLLYATHNANNARHNSETIKNQAKEQYQSLLNQQHPQHVEQMDAINKLKSTVEVYKEKVDTAINSISKNDSSKLSDSDFNFWEYFNYSFNDIQNYVNSIPLDKALALSHLVLLLLLIYLLFSVITIYYSNVLIDRFKIGEKFPKFKKMLDYRLKFQQYYIFYYIICSLSVMIFYVVFDILIFFDI